MQEHIASLNFLENDITLTPEQIEMCRNKLSMPDNSHDFTGIGKRIFIFDNPPRTFEEALSDNNASHFDISTLDLDAIGNDLRTKGEEQCSFDGFHLERPISLDYAEAYYVSEALTIVAAKLEDSPVDVTPIAETVLKVQTLLKESFGIDDNYARSIILLHPQSPMVVSHQSSEQGMILIGTMGIENLDSLDLCKVVAHEYAHAVYFRLLFDATGKNLEKVDEESPWLAISDFFNEGFAVYMQEVSFESSPRHLLRDQFENMYPLAKEDLLNGDLKSAYEDVSSWVEDNALPRLYASIHSRLLPGALIEFCKEKNIQLEEIFDVVKSRIRDVNNSFAENYGCTFEELGLSSSIISATKFLESRGYTITSSELVRQYDEMMKQAKVSPLDLIAGTMNKTNKEVEDEFLGWVFEG